MHALLSCAGPPHSFNAGHSALAWLLFGGPKIRLVAFDLGHHHYTHAAADFLLELVAGEGQFELIIGSSVRTVPTYAKFHPEFACDVIFIDGNHGGEVREWTCRQEGGDGNLWTRIHHRRWQLVQSLWMHVDPLAGHPEHEEPGQPHL